MLTFADKEGRGGVYKCPKFANVICERSLTVLFHLITDIILITDHILVTDQSDHIFILTSFDDLIIRR